MMIYSDGVSSRKSRWDMQMRKGRNKIVVVKLGILVIEKLCKSRAFLLLGISEITRANIGKLYNFERGYAEPDGLHEGWQPGRGGAGKKEQERGR